jgi:hypothetical protein
MPDDKYLLRDMYLGLISLQVKLTCICAPCKHLKKNDSRCITTVLIFHGPRRRLLSRQGERTFCRPDEPARVWSCARFQRLEILKVCSFWMSSVEDQCCCLATSRNFIIASRGALKMAKRPIQYHWFSLCRPCRNCDSEELRQCLASTGEE